MNAALQCLSNISSLTNYFLKNKNKFLNIPKYSNIEKISKAYSDVIYNLWDSNNRKGVFSPKYFKEIIGKENEMFKGNEANDSKDIILFLYQEIHNELNERKNNSMAESFESNEYDPELEYFRLRHNFECRNKSIISDIFFYDQVNITKCLKCRKSVYDFSMYNIMIFPLEKTRIFKLKKDSNFLKVNIFDCFEYHTKEAKQIHKDKFYCKNCKCNTDYEINSKISSLPEILTVILNRGNNLEFNVEFQIDYILDNLENYIIKLDSNKEQLHTKYELIGIIIHIGNSGNDGHFYAYCKSPVDKNWYSYNDEKVRYIKDPIQEIGGIPYLLFYQKIT